MSSNPEFDEHIRTGTFETNVRDAGRGAAVLQMHGCGPGVSTSAAS